MMRLGGTGVGRRKAGFSQGAGLIGALAICLSTAIASTATPAQTITGAARRPPDTTAQPVSSAHAQADPAQVALSTSIQLFTTGGGPGSIEPRHPLTELGPSAVDPTAPVTRLVALPRCDDARVSSVIFRAAGGEREFTDDAAAAFATVRMIGRIREQTVADVLIDARAVSAVSVAGFPVEEIEIVVTPLGATGPVSTNTGPFTQACEQAILNYRPTPDQAALWRPDGSFVRGVRSGTVTYCYSVGACANAEIDAMFVVPDSLASGPSTYSMAVNHADYFGLNIGIVRTSTFDELTPEAIRQFIQDVYETESAAHFRDGRLGFVLLIGDAFADDNVTVMLPSYDGYGAPEIACDHYYACVSGDDDFEDLMVGRLSVGNDVELSAAVYKATHYMPLPESPAWHDRVLLVAGTFYNNKDEYVALFDEYEETIPDEWRVDRIYRHDFADDEACAQAVVDSINNGYVLVNFAGDGWIFSWYETLRTQHIDLMSNSDRLPIVLSMACHTGWFDNTTEIDVNGSYDCLAEQLVNASGKGAIACLAAPRISDGGMFRTLTAKIHEAAFAGNSIFIGEMIAVAKLRHLQDGGDVSYVRHYNLFGDPMLVYRWDDMPSNGPDLTVKPHEVSWSPDIPTTDDNLEIVIPVVCQGPQAAGPVLVRVTDISEEGTDVYEATIPWIEGWADESVVIVIPGPAVGPHSIEVTVDPDDTIAEIEEGNNSFSRDVYVYAVISGFPVNLGTEAFGTCAAFLGDERHILVAGRDSRVLAVSPDGTVAWETTPYVEPLLYGPEIAPAAGDIDGDGQNEVVSIRRSGVLAFETDGDPMWSVNTDEPVGSPILADADGDGDLDIIVATRAVFGSGSELLALDEDGDTIWSHDLPSGSKATATPVVGDFNLDGRPDVVFGTGNGEVGAISTAWNPPVELWSPISLAAGSIAVLALADVDGDDLLELIVGADDLVVLNAENGTIAWSLPLGDVVISLAVADIDGDLELDIFAGTQSGTLHRVESGAEVWSAPLAGTPGSSSAIADIDGDGGLEILVGTDAGIVHILDADGADVAPPMPMPDAASTPFVTDHTGAAVPEVSVCSADGTLFLMGFGAAPGGLSVEWSGLGRDVRHSAVYAQPLEGTLDGQTLLLGRYVVTGDVVIPPSASLLIGPETLVEGDGTAARLEIRGEFTAAGMEDRRIIMRARPQPARGLWGGIELMSGATATLAHCRIEDATFALRSFYASIDLESCELTGNTYGLHATRSSVDAAGTVFALSDSAGAYLNNTGGSFSHCQFDACFRTGIVCDRTSTPEFVGCDFTNTLAGDGLACYSMSDVLVDSCRFSGNARHGAYVNASSPIFRNSEFRNNADSGIYNIWDSHLQLGRCIITQNYVGITGVAGALPLVGHSHYPLSGANAIWENEYVAIANYSGLGYAIQATGCWWGPPIPGSRLFLGPVIRVPYLDEPPFPVRDGVVASHDELPQTFRLAQNVPNPFNPTTEIRYEVPAPGGDLELAIYDVAGRRVATLHRGYRGPGVFQALWDGRNEHGERVASGMYFARMVAPGFTATRKMILLK
jgi:outer membrane protein assembly factor BamB